MMEVSGGRTKIKVMLNGWCEGAIGQQRNDGGNWLKIGKSN